MAQVQKLLKLKSLVSELSELSLLAESGNSLKIDFVSHGKYVYLQAWRGKVESSRFDGGKPLIACTTILCTKRHFIRSQKTSMLLNSIFCFTIVRTLPILVVA